MLVAEITGEARRHAKWRPLTPEEEAAAVTELRALAAGRSDLLAEVAGIYEGTSERSSTSRSPGAPRDCAARPEPTRRSSRSGPMRGGAGQVPPACPRSAGCSDGSLTIITPARCGIADAVNVNLNGSWRRPIGVCTRCKQKGQADPLELTTMNHYARRAG